MKRIVALFLAAALCLGVLAGCGRKDKQPVTPTPPPAGDKPNPDMRPDDDAKVPGKDTNPAPDTVPGEGTLKENAKLEDIVLQIGKELGITMPHKVDDNTLKDVFGIDPADIEEYYGEYSVVNTSSDHILAFKVKEGKQDNVKKALELRKDSVIKTFERYLPDQLEKAQNGIIVEKGPYLFFVIAGDIEKGIEKEMDRAKEIIDSYF